MKIIAIISNLKTQRSEAQNNDIVIRAIRNLQYLAHRRRMWGRCAQGHT